MSEILHDLGIEPAGLLINVVSFLLLLWLMRRYLFGPVGAVINQRRRRISQEVDAAEADRELAAQERRDVESKRSEILLAAEQDAEKAVEASKSDAAEVARQAREQAREMERAAHARTQRQVEEASNQLRAEVSTAAAQMSRAVLRQALTEERHRALVDGFIADIEKMAAEQQGS